MRWSCKIPNNDCRLRKFLSFTMTNVWVGLCESSQPVSFAHLIVAKLEYVGPTDKSTFTISQARLYSFTLIIN